MEDKEGGLRLGWASLPPELLRRVVQQLLSDWHYAEPCKPSSSLLPVRSTCTAWRAVVDSDVTHLALTVPSVAPGYLALNFPHVTSLDMSRYQRSCQDVFPVMQQLQLRSLALADPWDPPASLPTQSLTELTYLSFLADGLLVPHLASQLCAALGRLRQLQHLALSRLQLSQAAAQQLAHTLAQLPHLEHLALSGGATPVSTADLYVLLNVDLPALRCLELVRLGSRMLPMSLTRLAGLTKLTFSGEMVRNLPLSDELRQLSNLQVLDISANLAEQLPVGVLELSGLRELHAGMNRLGVHMHSFRKLEELQVLVLASNKLQGVHPSLWSLASLVRLDLGHNNLAELPQDISQLTGLTFLSVCHNFLTALPTALSCLVDLVELDVSLNTDMRELPQGLGQLSKLTRLTASHMRLKQLPIDVGGLVSLVHLDVSHNSLHHLSPALSCLVELTHLEASDNKLHQSAAVPEELASLSALRVLRLARNRLQTLPDALGCYGRLQILDCSGNRLTSVPRVVGRCTALQQLLMASNRLRGLTSGIGNLMRLQVLDLSHNQYRHLPTMTGDLTQLQSLLLEDNQLEDLPSSCSALVKLTQLTLSNNRLHVLPPAISRMSGLQTLSLSCNPLLGRHVVVLQLQRQLPSLTVDHLPPLQCQHREAQHSSDHVALGRPVSAEQQQLQASAPVPPAATDADASTGALAAGAVAGASAAQAFVPPWVVQMGHQGGPSSGSGRVRSSLAQMLEALAEGANFVQPQTQLARLLSQNHTDIEQGMSNAIAITGATMLQEGDAEDPAAEAAAAIAAACARSALGDGASSSAAAAAAGSLNVGAAPSSVSPLAWLLGGSSGALGTASTPCPWQRLLATQLQQPGHQPTRALAAQSSAAASAAAAGASNAAVVARSEHQQAPVWSHDTARHAGPQGDADVQAGAAYAHHAGVLQQSLQQQHSQAIACSGQAEIQAEDEPIDDAGSEGASLARTSSHMGSVDGGGVHSVDGNNVGAGDAATAIGVAAALTGLSALNLHGGSSNSISTAAGGSGNFAARVKSYLEVATSSNNSSAGGASATTATMSRQGSAGLLLRPSEAGSGSSSCCQHLHQHLHHHHHQQQQQMQQMQQRPDGLCRAGNAGYSGVPGAPGSSMFADGANQPLQATDAASSSAAAAAGGIAALTPCGEVDEASSTGGMESCGSEDSGSEVLLRLGTLQTSTHSYAAAHEQALACAPAAGGGFSMNSRCPSSASSGAAGIAGGTGAVGAAGVSVGVAAEGADARDADAESCTTNGDDGEGSLKDATGQQPAQTGMHSAPTGSVSSWQPDEQPQHQALAQQRQLQAGHHDRSFAHVLESAWWGQRRG